MKFIPTTNGKCGIRSWCDNIEDSAMKQIENISGLPFISEPIVIMPDCHTGYSVPIGCVFKTNNNIIIPNAVGNDIGCGVGSTKTNLKYNNIKPNLKRILGGIRDIIPIGKNINKNIDSHLSDYVQKLDIDLNKIKMSIDPASQLGTLGGGNHFIEFEKDKNDNIWITVHTGSRNIGATVARYYNDKAVELCTKYYSTVPKDYSFLSLDDEIGKEYYNTMIK
jgi:tRNA-splicing ligase RtcB